MLRTLDRHPWSAISGLIPALSCRSVVRTRRSPGASATPTKASPTNCTSNTRAWRWATEQRDATTSLQSHQVDGGLSLARFIARNDVTALRYGVSACVMASQTWRNGVTVTYRHDFPTRTRFTRRRFQARSGGARPWSIEEVGLRRGACGASFEQQHSQPGVSSVSASVNSATRFSTVATAASSVEAPCRQ